MNDISDLSDRSEGSQLAEFKENIDEISKLLTKYTRSIHIPGELDVFEVIIMHQVICQKDSPKYFKIYLDKNEDGQDQRQIRDNQRLVPVCFQTASIPEVYF